MPKFLHAARMALPTLFFGYALLANLSLATGQNPAVDLPECELLSGGLTRDLDSLYKSDLPHRDLSFNLIGAARYTVLGEARQGAIVGQGGWLFTAEELRPQPSDPQLDGVVSTVRDIATQLRAQGTDLVVVPLPAKIDIYRDKSPDRVFGQALETLYARFSDQLAVQSVGVVDARDALTNPAAPVFFATDTHWTPHGAKLVATAVAASGTIDRGALEYDLVRRDAKALTGDLIRFITSNDFAPRIGLPPETIVQRVQTPVDAGFDIFGDADHDIVLVGTSYSANDDWGFADALMRTLGRDVVNVAQQGLGPLQPMRDYLEGPDFRNTPPAVVIWEIPIRYLTDETLWPAASEPASELVALSTKEPADG